MASIFTLDLSIHKIVSFIKDETLSLQGVGDEIEEIKLELISMRSFLEDADKKGILTNTEKNWVASVRDKAYKVEDIIDEFMYHMSRQQNYGKYTKIFHQTIHAPKNLWERHQLATKLQKIKKQITNIPKRIQRYGVYRLEGTSSSHYNSQWVKTHGESSLFMRNEDLVGIKDAKEALIGWLQNDEPQRTVISVVGMGGLGKTTLVANTFNSQIVRRHFNCYAWITVSQTYEIENLFKLMIKDFSKEANEELTKELSAMSYRELVETLSSFLQRKRYVVVLDDLWTTNLWREINVALPNGMHGSRVIITTRREDIACSNFGFGSHIHQIQPLKKDEAWELFCMKAFSSNANRCCPPEFVSLARDIVEKCKGLPLAIVALGGLMSSKMLLSDWSRIYNSLNVELNNNPDLEVMKRILLLSFNDLPYQLKSCFLYCCIFPEDYKIQRKRLIRLWIAEGFVEKAGGATPEEVAEGYLIDLIHRSMLQVVERNSYGRPRKCQMHDLLREIALSISKTEEFCVVYDGREAIDQESRARRLSMQAQDEKIRSGKFISQLRSFFLFPAHNISESSLNATPLSPQLRSFFLRQAHNISKSSLNAMSLNFKLLSVLDLEDDPIDKLPDELGKLFNLKYLNLTGTQVEKLPKSIGKLTKLQTLYTKHSKIRELPCEIGNLQNLRHLITYQCHFERLGKFDVCLGARVPSNICMIKSLQVLGGVEVEGDLIKQLKNATKLRTIVLVKVKEADGRNLCIAIENMKLLRTLGLIAANEEECVPTDAFSSAPPCLEKLDLIGKLKNMPRWFNSLQSLKTLHLHCSGLKEDLLPHIQALPNLARLLLVNAYEGNRLWFLQGFQKLELLAIWDFSQLNEIVVEKGVMPRVRKLYLSKCVELKTVPHGIEYLTHLEEFHLFNASDELVECIRGDQSVDYPKVKHIANIRHFSQMPSKWFYERLS